MQDSSVKFKQGIHSLSALTRLPSNQLKGREERVRELVSWMENSFEKSPSLRSELRKLDAVRAYLDDMLTNKNYDHSADMVRDMLYSFRLHLEDWEHPVEEPPEPLARWSLLNRRPRAPEPLALDPLARPLLTSRPPDAL